MISESLFLSHCSTTTRLLYTYGDYKVLVRIKQHKPSQYESVTHIKIGRLKRDSELWPYENNKEKGDYTLVSTL